MLMAVAASVCCRSSHSDQAPPRRRLRRRRIRRSGRRRFRRSKPPTSRSRPRSGGILFIGSSSIRLWKTLGQDFPNQPVLNRGFGGSRIADSTHFAPRIVLPYKPRLIVMYAGGNDINDGRHAGAVASDFHAVRRDRAGKACPRRASPTSRLPATPRAGHRWIACRQANALIEAYTKHTPNMAFIDIFPHMLDADGQPRPELFVEDRLHMNAAGYAIWTKIVAPFLDELSRCRAER